MQKTILILAVLLVAGFAMKVHDEEFRALWNSWKSVHQKFYSAVEDNARFAIFMDNYHKVIKFNAEHTTPKLGLNKFSDLTATEFKAIYASGYVEPANIQRTKVLKHNGVKFPDSIDWRTQGAVTGVKDQGQCGSCWAFSTTGTLEGLQAIHRGGLQSFSEQQLVDCDGSDGGCNGGFPGNALQYTAGNGIDHEDAYPYHASGGQCSYAGNGDRVNGGFDYVNANDRDSVKYVVSDYGPVSVGVEADEGVFQQYSSGVITGGCGNNRDHAVLIVGYGSIDGVDSFIVKNSWSSGWGQGGYVYISTDPGQNGGAGVCGILATPLVAV